MVTEQKSLRPTDLAVALRLEHHPGERYQSLADALGLSLSAVHRAVQRLELSGLLRPDSKSVNRPALLAFIIGGVRYAFPPSLGSVVRGVPTASALPALKGKFPEGADVVWPAAEGTIRGTALAPLYQGAPAAALKDERLHLLLALVDAMRIGQARDRKSAEDLLRQLLMQE